MPGFKTEKKLWDHLATRMRGRWERLEAITPSGMPDCFGFYRGETHWLELKCGQPDFSALRSDQVAFGSACGAAGIPFWVCFGYRGRPIFFQGLNLTLQVQPPWFIISSATRLSGGTSIARASSRRSPPTGSAS